MLLELHLIQNFAPSNLNRDDTNSPKDCDFGGYRRARISSQCLKRAMRNEFKKGNLVPEDQLAVRTKRLREEVARRIAGGDRSKEDAEKVVEFAMSGFGLAIDEKTGKSQYLLFLGSDEIDRFADVCGEHWDELAKVALGDGGRRSKGDAKTLFAKDLKDVREELMRLLDGGRAADLALWGRMLADIPEKNIDAASQVAHAISTHRVSTEFDYYTAVDDLKPEDTEGADMIGTVEFNSACFYRYLNVDVEQLGKTLGGDADLTRRAVEAFIRATVTAVPSGKQNSFAAYSRPSLVLGVVRSGGPVSLANAFVRPVVSGSEGDLVHGSIKALDAYWGKLTGVYGDGDVVATTLVTLDEEALGSLGAAKVEPMTFQAFVAQTVSAALGG